MRPVAGFVLAVWLIAGLPLTLQPAHPLPASSSRTTWSLPD
jgi:hypothetical protein